MKKSNILYINKKVDVLRPDSKEKEFCMETVRTKKSKFLVILIVFMILFSNCGYTIAAIATSDEFQVINNGFFKKDEIKFNAYFEDENGNQMDEFTGNVNQKVKLVLEVLPQVEGYLKNATIKAVSADDDNINFRISNVSQNVIEGLEANSNSNLDDVGSKIEEEAVKEESQDPAVEENKEETNTVVNENTNVSENVQQNENSENTVTEVEKNEATNEVTNETNNANNETTNAVTDEITNSSNDTSNNNVVNETEISEVINETVANEIAIEENNNVNQEANNVASDSVVSEEDELVNEEEVIIEKTEAADKLQEEIANAALDISLTADDEIKLTNIIEDTKIIADLEYVQGETLKVSDLYKNIKLQISGTYINSDLEEVQIGKEEEVTLGWEYSKDIELTSEYTKFSPFEIGDIKGTIVENKISVKREITDTKYLPIKSTKLEITVPKVNGKAPIEVDVVANKLMATRGEDTGYTNFTQANWNYDKESGKIVTVVENTEALNTNGIDEYVVIYRYEDYISEENSNLDKVVKASVEEYSSNENNILTKEINDRQSIKIDVGELITYNISSTEDKINKAKIYANYNSETPVYETEYTTQVNVNILTSDILEELKIDSTKEYYITSNNLELQAQGIEYKQIKFNYSEISSILSAGGEIVITNANGELLYTLNSSLVTKEEDCTINLNGANGILVYARNIAKNGNISFELTKAIKNCNYEKSTFKDITQIESRITAEVKYQAIEETLALGAIGTRKEFEESSTSATLSINKETLTTIQDNNNVELKIELNNDKENSDLYVNPTFELVFPKYVKAVSVQSINLLYENGLQVSDFNTYTESDIVKMRIELVGTQKTFSESSITNGTNIVVNVNIEVDDYTPSKEDQIKLYYYNEGVSNYQSQTKWTINKQIPNGILKTTNGFDVALIKYQAPKGLIAINGIVNYDGNLSEIRSVKQGKVTKQIAINGPARVATMELLALNNTENECSDLVLIGRVPFKGNKDVISNEDLGTTTDTIVRDLIKEDIQNSNMSTIYYSTNPNATKDLNNEANGWTTEVTDPSTIKSYLIVVNGKLKAGEVLRYTYDFEIPANLPYETSIAGSFGAYYNNNTDVAVVYESSSADIVGLTTEAGPKMEAKLSVDVGDGTEVLSFKRLKYTVSVTNSGSVAANDVIANCIVPQYTNYLTKDPRSAVGDYGYMVASGDYSDGIKFNLGTINPGETKEATYYVRTYNKPTLEEYAYKDDNGYYIITGYEDKEVQKEQIIENPIYDENGELIGNENTTETITVIESVPIKEYITEVPDIYITNKATITSALMANPIETNEVKNKLNQANFASEIRLDYDREIQAGVATNFTLLLTNTSRKDMKNVVATLNVGDIYEYVSGTIDEKSENIEYIEEEGKIYYYIGDMAANQVVTLTTCVMSKQIDSASKTVDCYFEFYADEVAKEISTVVPQTVSKAVLEATDMTINLPESINENETATISTLITNISTVECSKGILEFEIPESVIVSSVRVSNGELLANASEGNIYSATLPLIHAKESITIDITLKAKNLSGTDSSEATIIRKIKNTDQEDVVLEPVEFTINNNLKTDEEIEEDRVNDLIEQDQNNQANQENNSNNNSNNSSNDNTNNDSNGNSQDSIPGSNQDIVTPGDNNSNNTNNTNNNSNTTDNLQNTPNAITPKYSISGVSWLDTNKDGIKTDDETKMAGVKVYLLNTNGTMIKSTITAVDGTYQFNEVENGNYVIAVSYDETKYKATIYKKDSSLAENNSYIMENDSEDISAVTNEINVANQNVGNINIGLQNREIFDLVVNKYISKVKVENGKYSEEYNFDNLELAKVEIPSRRINSAKVTLEYTVSIENIGDLEGYAENVIDYLNSDLQFDESQNSEWFKGTDGYIYVKNINQTLLKPGDKKEIKLILTKTMDGNNTGTHSNKVAILEAYSSDNVSENAENNNSVQNTLILVSTGGATTIIIFIIAIILIILIMFKTNIINKDTFKGKYKEKIKKKINVKKVYK